MSTILPASQTGFKKVLSGLDITLFTISAILVVDTLAPTAAIGPSAISWLLITIVLFFIPYGVITAELSSAYPDQGGIYAWVKRGLGDSWASRTAWLYWVNAAIWMPSVFILFSGVLSQLFFPNLGLWPQIGIAILMSWITVFIGIIPLERGKWTVNVGAFVKIAIIATIGIAGILFGMRNGFANDFTLTNLLPNWNAGLNFLPIIVYNFLGFELMSSAGAEIKNPRSGTPRAILFSGILIAVFYLLGTTGILMVLPTEKLGFLDSIVDTLRALFGATGMGNIFVIVLGIGVLYSFLANMITWTMGSNRTAAEAAARGDLPAVFGKLHPTYKTPINAYVLTGMVSTIAVIIYGLLGSGSLQNIFTTLFELSGIALLIPYLFVFLAFVELRRTDPNTPRPYKVPVDFGGATLLASLGILFIAQAILFFVWTPGVSLDWMYAAPILIGLVVLLILGEVLWANARKHKA